MKTISYKEYLMVEGLMALARKNIKETEEIEQALADILAINKDKEDDMHHYGLWSDYMFGDKPVKNLLKVLGIKVIKEKKKEMGFEGKVGE